MKNIKDINNYFKWHQPKNFSESERIFQFLRKEGYNGDFQINHDKNLPKIDCDDFVEYYKNGKCLNFDTIDRFNGIDGDILVSINNKVNILRDSNVLFDTWYDGIAKIKFSSGKIIYILELDKETKIFDQSGIMPSDGYELLFDERFSNTCARVANRPNNILRIYKMIGDKLVFTKNNYIYLLDENGKVYWENDKITDIHIYPDVKLYFIEYDYSDRYALHNFEGTELHGNILDWRLHYNSYHTYMEINYLSNLSIVDIPHTMLFINNQLLHISNRNHYDSDVVKILDSSNYYKVVGYFNMITGKNITAYQYYKQRIKEKISRFFRKCINS